LTLRLADGKLLTGGTFPVTLNIFIDLSDRTIDGFGDTQLRIASVTNKEIKFDGEWYSMRPVIIEGHDMGRAHTWLSGFIDRISGELRASNAVSQHCSDRQPGQAHRTKA
jgi:hypothetical protein